MKGHIAYISLLILSFGFIAYLKIELDSLEENYSKEYVIIKRKHSGLVEVEKKLRSDIEKLEIQREKLTNSLKGELKALENSLQEKEVDLNKCQTEKNSFKESFEKIVGEQNSQSERILKFQLDIDNCNREKEQLALQVNEEAQGNARCEAQRQQCEQDKVAYVSEIDALREASSCEGDKAQVEKLNGELSQCYQTNQQIELEKTANSESFHACSGQLHECDEVRTHCHQLLESANQSILSQQQNAPSPPQQQQNAPPQQQQQNAPPQQQQNAPPPPQQQNQP